MAEVHRIGFTRLSATEQRGEEPRLKLQLTTYSIVFIHGLRGHPRNTWATHVDDGASNGRINKAFKKREGIKALFKRSSPDQSAADSPPSPHTSMIFWPEDYLAKDFPEARVWTYGYNADAIGGLFQANNQNSVSQHGRDLVVRLERDIDNEKPLTFIVHSLGGIVVKDAIRRSDKIRQRTKLLVFLGTPHRGSGYAGWGQIASNLARVAWQDTNKNLLKTLEVNSEVLDNIHEDFKTIAFKGAMQIHSLQESRGISGLKGLDGMVVDKFSSKLDLPNELETVETIDADHMQMTRCSSPGDQIYRAISGIVKKFMHSDSEMQQMLEEEQEAVKQPIIPAVAGDTSSEPQFIVPFARDALFVGREDLLDKIRRRTAADRSHTRVALAGLGGVGKSQIAIEYAYRHQEEAQPSLIVWIHASNAAGFRQGYGNLADILKLPGRDNPAIDILQLVYNWLSDKRNGSWLMILDNVDDDNVFFSDRPDTSEQKPLHRFLPQVAHGGILITSRNQVAAAKLLGGHASVIPVGPMSEEEALALLHTRVPNDESDRDDAEVLVNTLERIPLAITHAAAYIQTRRPMATLKHYLKLFRESEANQIRLLNNDEWKDIRRDDSSQTTVIATWYVSFQHIRTTRPQAADLLALMSMFDRQGVRCNLLQGSRSELDFEDALAPLLSFSLVRMDEGKQALEMHRLVQMSMKRWLEGQSELGKWVKLSLEALSTEFPEVSYETWETCKFLLPHVQAVIGYATDDEVALQRQALCAYRAAFYLLDRREYIMAADLAHISLTIREEFLEQEHPYIINSVSLLGSILDALGKYAEAEVMHRRALKAYEKKLMQEYLDILGNSSDILLEDSRRREYRNMFACIGNLGTVLMEQIKCDQAEAMYRRALEGQEKLLGSEHHDTLVSVTNIGVILMSRGKYKEAEPLHRRFTEGLEKTLGLEQPEPLLGMLRLAGCYHRQQLFVPAIDLYQRAYPPYEKIWGAKERHVQDWSKMYALAVEHRSL